MGWKESKVSRKRRKKIDFDLTLLEDNAKRGSIGLTPARSRRKKKHAHISIAPSDRRQNARHKGHINQAA